MCASSAHQAGLPEAIATRTPPDGYAVAEGYHMLQFAGVGGDFQVIKDINAMYQAQSKPVPTAQEVSVFYNRGVMVAAIHAEAVRNAIKAKV